MQILQRAQVFGGTFDDPEFLHTAIVYSDDRNIFLAHVLDRISTDAKINIDELRGVLISPERVFPSFDPAAFNLCPNPTSSEIFVKRPNFLEYDQTNNVICEVLLQEARICEALKNFRHVNIAEYLGCQVENSRITGRCFKKYEITLLDKMKKTNASFDHRSCIEGIRSGIEHLHRHGYCHNDINPLNIMFDENDTPIIIDFDSCQPEGDELGHKGGTIGWDIETSQKSQPWNDIHGLNKIQNYLETYSAAQ